MFKVGLRNFSCRRGFAVAAATTAKTSPPPNTVPLSEEQTNSSVDEVLNYESDANSLKMLHIDASQSPTASLMLMVRGGSRYEPSSGVAHALSRFAFKATNKRSSLRICRESEHLGGVLYTQLGRENMLFSARFLKEDLAYYVDLFGEVLESSAFKRYELPEIVLPSCVLDLHLAKQNGEAYALDLLHKAAYRNGLGNSLYVNPDYYPSLAGIKQFAETAYSPENSILMSSGVSSSDFFQLARQRFSPKEQGQISQQVPRTQFHSGIVRESIKLSNNICALGLNTGEILDEERLIITSLLGGSPQIKWVPGSGILGKAAAELSGTSVETSTVNYSDASMIVVNITSEPKDSMNNISAVIKSLKDSENSLNESELKRSKMQAKFKILSAFEDNQKILAQSGAIALSTNAPPNYTGLLSRIDEASMESVRKALKTILEPSNIASAAVGNISNIPYHDDI